MTQADTQRTYRARAPRAPARRRDAAAPRRRRATPRHGARGSADVVVVGAGLAGLTAARERRRRGQVGARAGGAQPRRRPRVEPRARRRRGTPSAAAPSSGPTQDHILDAREGARRRDVPDLQQGNNVYVIDGQPLDLERHRARPAPRRRDPHDPRRARHRRHAARRDVEGGAGRRAVGGGQGARVGRPDARDAGSTEQHRRPSASASSCPLATRPIFGAEPRELSLLFVLFYIAASGDETQRRARSSATSTRATARRSSALRGRLAAPSSQKMARAARPAAHAAARRCGGSSSAAGGVRVSTDKLVGRAPST